MQYNYGQNYGGDPQGQQYGDAYGQHYGGAPQGQPYGAPPQAPPSWGVMPANYNPGLYAQSSFPPSPHGQSSSDAYGNYAPRPDAAEKRMQALEIMEKRDEIKEERRKVKLKQNKKLQKLEDAENAAKIIAFLGVWDAFMWALPCFGNSWSWRMFNGFGIGGLTISTSLLAINVELYCDKKGPIADHIENKVCRLFEPLNGTQSLHHAMDLGCSIHFNHEACNAMSTLYYTSFMIIFCFMISALTSILGGICMYYYYFLSPLKKIRETALVCFAVSPVTGIAAFFAYSALSPDLGDLPRAWTSIVSTLDGGLGTFAIRPTGETNIFTRCGWCWFFCWISMAFSIAGVIVFLAFFKKHHGEKAAMKDERREKRQMEREIESIEDRCADLEFPDLGPENNDASNYGADAQQPYYAASDQAVPLHKAAYPPGGSYAPSSTTYASGPSSGYSSYPPNSQGSYPPTQESYPPSMQGGYPQGGYSPGGYETSPAAGVGGYPGYPQYGPQ
mmetsp:Transcript_98723/g.171018  ORF Transcript_98723/g.171018 Transcript_98723/m.171018 type:complete len:503 (+) Transcript_98723:115-1623(+)